MTPAATTARPSRNGRIAAAPRAAVIDPNDPHWDRLVLRHPQADIFHSAAWARVLTATYGHQPHYLRFSNGRQTTALLPLLEVRSALTGKRGVTLPFSDFCSPLLFETGTFPFVFETTAQIARKRAWKYCEIRHSPIRSNGTQPGPEFFSHRIDLSDGLGKSFARLSSSARRAVHKAERSGVTIEVSRTEGAMRAFYRLHVRTRRRHGLPPQPWNFFLNIARELCAFGLGFIMLALQDGVPIAGAVFFHFGRMATYKFGACDERRLASRPNNLLMWKALEHLTQLGFKSLDLGRTSLGHHGLRRFKLSLGAEEKRVSYHRFASAHPGRDEANGWHNAVFSRLPLSLNCLAGSVIYPHLD